MFGSKHPLRKVSAPLELTSASGRFASTLPEPEPPPPRWHQHNRSEPPGEAGGGGGPAIGRVAIDDDFTPGAGFFQTTYQTAVGDRNRSDGRHGDYYTVRPYSPCDNVWIATNYGLFATSINSRVVFFGRGRDRNCYLEWRFREPHQ